MSVGCKPDPAEWEFPARGDAENGLRYIGSHKLSVCLYDLHERSFQRDVCSEVNE